ncbi:C4-dicarboxylic acid transporter DauA [Campylobacter ureolyticus]|uniref:C4-dicarboxylic acid transporter DauA n=1 Tax=Campylobacter ureolyticus TaxID=827 RepID=A0A6N2RAE3_9BACT
MLGLTIATMMAGVMLVVIGFLKGGEIIKFIPYPVVAGFTSGIAITIFSSQIKDILGLDVEKNSSSIYGTNFVLHTKYSNIKFLRNFNNHSIYFYNCFMAKNSKNW